MVVEAEARDEINAASLQRVTNAKPQRIGALLKNFDYYYSSLSGIQSQ